MIAEMTLATPKREANPQLKSLKIMSTTLTILVTSVATLSDASFTYNVEYLGDYNHSGHAGEAILDADDIDTLVTYWGSTRYEYELGPCLGGPCLPANLPNLIPAFDGKWNMEDVMSFYIMWNHAVGRTLSRSQVDNIGEPAAVYFDNNNLN